jgi:hypothetical protein
MCPAGHDDQTELMRFLIEKCRGDVNYKNQKGQTQLHAAARSGYPETDKLFLKYSPDVNAQDNDGLTPLMCCAEAGREFISFDQNGRTMYGPYGKPDGHIETIRVLIRAGADVNLRNRKGTTAADLAAEKKFPDILAALNAGPEAPPRPEIEKPAADAAPPQPEIKKPVAANVPLQPEIKKPVAANVPLQPEIKKPVAANVPPQPEIKKPGGFFRRFFSSR